MTDSPTQSLHPAGVPDAVHEKLGRFGHHPDPAIDFCIEVGALTGRLFDAKGGISKPGTEPETVRAVLHAIQDAMMFRVGGDGDAVYAKHLLRGVEQEALAALTKADAPLDAGLSAEPVASFQARVQPWMMACFGAEISADREERGDRLLEEVFELLQSGGYDPSRVAALRDYVWGREKGEPHQEAGGAQVTLAAYCLAHGLDMHQAGEDELTRIWTKVEKIRAKQAAKPTGSALPVSTTSADLPAGAQEVIAEMVGVVQPRYGYSCFSCRATTPNAFTMEKAEEEAGLAGWQIGTDSLGQAHYSCPGCAPGLFNTMPVASPAIRTALSKAEAFQASTSQAPQASTMGGASVIAEVAAERCRQVEVEGHTSDFDALRPIGVLARAAASYAYVAGLSDTWRAKLTTRPLSGLVHQMWPWGPQHFKPKDRRRDLIRAAALLIAEIERLDRATPPVASLQDEPDVEGRSR